MSECDNTVLCSVWHAARVLPRRLTMLEQPNLNRFRTTFRVVSGGLLVIFCVCQSKELMAQPPAYAVRGTNGGSASPPVGFAGAIHRLLADADSAIARGDYERAYRLAVRAHKMAIAAGPVVVDDPVCEPNGLAEFVRQLEAYRVPVRASVATTTATPPSAVPAVKEAQRRAAPPRAALWEDSAVSEVPPAPEQSADPAEDWAVAANVPRATPQNVIEPVRYFPVRDYSARAVLGVEQVGLSPAAESGVTNILQGGDSNTAVSPWEKETLAPGRDLAWATPNVADSVPMATISIATASADGEPAADELVTPFAPAPSRSVVTAEFADEWAADSFHNSSQEQPTKSEPLTVSHLPILAAEPIAFTAADPETIPASDRLAEPLGIWKPRPPQQSSAVEPDGLRVASASSLIEGDVVVPGVDGGDSSSQPGAVKLVSLEAWKTELAPTPAEAALQDAAVNPHWVEATQWAEASSTSTNGQGVADQSAQLPVAVKSVQVGVRHSPRQLALLATLGGCGALVFALGAGVLLRVASQSVRRRSTTPNNTGR